MKIFRGKFYIFLLVNCILKRYRDSLNRLVIIDPMLLEINILKIQKSSVSKTNTSIILPVLLLFFL